MFLNKWNTNETDLHMIHYKLYHLHSYSPAFMFVFRLKPVILKIVDNANSDMHSV